jgi:hypothetical protein
LAALIVIIPSTALSQSIETLQTRCSRNACPKFASYGGQGKAAGAATLAALLSEISRIIGEGALSSLYVGARLPITMDSR